MDKSDYKVIYAILISIVLVITMTITYNLYTNSKNRELYNQCMEFNKEVVKDNPSSINTVYCHP